MKLRPIVIAYEALPDDKYIEPLQNAITGPNGVDNFFEAYGMPLSWGPVELVKYTGLDYRTDYNPWGKIYPFLNLNPGEGAVAILTDWVESTALGWGGYPLALAGRYAADRLLTFGTPDYIVDDFHTMGIIAHEVGHVLGFNHDTVSPSNIMWHWWLWPDCYPSKAMADAHRDAAPAPLSRLSMYLDYQCPRPNHDVP